MFCKLIMTISNGVHYNSVPAIIIIATGKLCLKFLPSVLRLTLGTIKIMLQAPPGLQNVAGELFSGGMPSLGSKLSRGNQNGARGCQRG